VHKRLRLPATDIQTFSFSFLVMLLLVTVQPGDMVRSATIYHKLEFVLYLLSGFATVTFTGGVKAKALLTLLI